MLSLTGVISKHADRSNISVLCSRRQRSSWSLNDAFMNDERRCCRTIASIVEDGTADAAK
jgi:hypothetical protein